MSNTNKIAIIVALLVLIAVMPLAFVWSLNTLFGLGIAYGFWTWLAALILVASIGGNVKRQSN
jgi:hypothetical protein